MCVWPIITNPFYSWKLSCVSKLFMNAYTTEVQEKSYNDEFCGFCWLGFGISLVNDESNSIYHLW